MFGAGIMFLTIRMTFNTSTPASHQVALQLFLAGRPQGKGLQHTQIATCKVMQQNAGLTWLNGHRVKCDLARTWYSLVAVKRPKLARQS
jgi:hypothetical protein